MTAYDPLPWHDLFVMTGGAAAALAGLIFVAVSLNHEAILEIPALPALAARTVGILIGTVVLCAVGLAPDQSATALGVEVLVVALVTAAIVVGTTVQNLTTATRGHWRANLLGMAVVSTVPGVVAGVSLLAGAGGGLYWLLAQFVVGIVVAVYNAWVLLVEIRR